MNNGYLRAWNSSASLDTIANRRVKLSIHDRFNELQGTNIRARSISNESRSFKNRDPHETSKFVSRKLDLIDEEKCDKVARRNVPCG